MSVDPAPAVAAVRDGWDGGYYAIGLAVALVLLVIGVALGLR